MKVLHVLDHSVPELDGYAIRSASIVRYQLKTGIEPVVLTSSQHRAYKTDTETIDGIRYYRTRVYREPSIPIFREMLRVRRLESRLAEIISIEKPDVLHAHSPALWGKAVSRMAKRHKIPFVYEIRGFWEDAAVDRGKTTTRSLRYKLSRALETMVAHSADTVTTIANPLKADLVRRGIAADKVVLVPNGVDGERFVASPVDKQLLEELGISGRARVGYLGSLFAWEGVRQLIRAVPEIVARVPNLVVLIIGHGEQESAIRSLVNELNVADHVRLIGAVRHEDVKRYYSVLDVLVYPRESTRNTETCTPLKPLEAMAMEKAVVASDVGGLRELLVDGTGLRFGAGNTNELARKCVELISQPKCRLDLGQRARTHVLTNHNWKTLIGAYHHVYSGICCGSQATSTVS